MAPNVRDNTDSSRFEIVVDGDVAGFAAYRMVDDRLVFTHTEIEDDHEGEGLGSLLVRSALDEARRTKRHVVAQCPFVSSYIEHHPDYADLVDKEMSERLER